MKRRDFITLVGGAATWPLAARAQQPDAKRRIGIFMNFAAADAQSEVRVSSFLHGMQELGWTVGRNIEIDYRWSTGDPNSTRKDAAELIALKPDVILASASATLGMLQQLTHTVPIVFVGVIDPVGAGFVETLSRPGGNITGFTPFEYGTSGKWPELLKEIAPDVTRAAVLRDPRVASGIGQLGAIQSVAPSLRIELSPVAVNDAGDIERAITAMSRSPNGSLIIVGAPSIAVHRELIISLAARHRLPAVYPYSFYVADGGLISYGPDVVVESRGGISPPRAPRTVHEPLDSHGSRWSAVAIA
jgi:putative tryptophan/tyrosine transport system substrate-binding protein